MPLPQFHSRRAPDHPSGVPSIRGRSRREPRAHQFQSFLGSEAGPQLHSKAEADLGTHEWISVQLKTEAEATGHVCGFQARGESPGNTGDYTHRG